MVKKKIYIYVWELALASDHHFYSILITIQITQATLSSISTIHYTSYYTILNNDHYTDYTSVVTIRARIHEQVL